MNDYVNYFICFFGVADYRPSELDSAVTRLNFVLWQDAAGSAEGSVLDIHDLQTVLPQRSQRAKDTS